jgi:4-hydroxy-3-methylbut-2-enyl diphosphate reductase
MIPKPSLDVVMASPRGFCAGVLRAVLMVERALEKYGAPVYVRHQIVHNKHVVQRLERLGAIFVDDLNDIPAGTQQPVLYSAHGVSKDVVQQGKDLNLLTFDATCPLVSKVHREVGRAYDSGDQVIMIGHAGHAEVIGTMGQAPEGAVLLVQNQDDVQTVTVRDPDHLVYVTQTTLSVQETEGIIWALLVRFPNIKHPKNENICYATTNRQAAVTQIAPKVDVFLIIGDQNSSNSKRLLETAFQAGARGAYLLPNAQSMDWTWLKEAKRVGISSGASAPDDLVSGLLEEIKARYDIRIEEVSAAFEDVSFKIPAALSI